MKRKIDDRTFLSYLFQYLNVNDLKSVCREFNVKGYSKLKKSELIEFILDSISEEEMSELLENKELDIVNDGIQVALKKIDGEDRERISNIRIVNSDEHEIELKFKGMNWETTSYLSITSDNIDNPERDCDCRIGSNMGLSNHFWVGVIFSYKKGWFTIEKWSLTKLPENFEKNIKPIKISVGNEEEENESINLINESTEGFQMVSLIDKSITLYEGEIIEVEQKTQVFQEISTIYYILFLKNVKLGPRIKKKSDFQEEDIIQIDNIYVRISEKLHDENSLKPGDNIKANGKLTKDNFLKILIIKNVRKIEKL